MIKDLLNDGRFSEDGKKRILTHWLNNDLYYADKEEVDNLVVDLKEKGDDDFYSATIKRLEFESFSR
jgi:hypothetical protein